MGRPSTPQGCESSGKYSLTRPRSGANLTPSQILNVGLKMFRLVLAGLLSSFISTQAEARTIRYEFDVVGSSIGYDHLSKVDRLSGFRQRAGICRSHGQVSSSGSGSWRNWSCRSRSNEEPLLFVWQFGWFDRYLILCFGFLSAPESTSVEVMQGRIAFRKFRHPYRLPARARWWRINGAWALDRLGHGTLEVFSIWGNLWNREWNGSDFLGRIPAWLLSGQFS